MGVDINSMFAGMATAKMNGKGKKLGDGKYRVSAKSIKLKKDGYYGDSVIFEFEVVRSVNEDHGPGSSRSWTVNLKKDQAFGDIKALLMALVMGLDPSKFADTKRYPKEHAEATEWFKAAIDPDFAKSKSLEENFVAGLEVDVEVTWMKTKQNFDWALHVWSPTPETSTQAAA